jgi:hypothetical protein
MGISPHIGALPLWLNSHFHGPLRVENHMVVRRFRGPLSRALAAWLLMAGMPVLADPPAQDAGLRVSMEQATPLSAARDDGTEEHAPAPAAAVLADLRPGLWEYHRTQLKAGENQPQAQTLRRCVDPSSEFKKKMADLAARGCTFHAPKQHGSRLEMAWSCRLEGDQVISVRDVITVQGPEGYHDESDAIAPQGATHSSLSAVRVGDCMPDIPSRQAPAAPATSVPSAPAPRTR